MCSRSLVTCAALTALAVFGPAADAGMFIQTSGTFTGDVNLVEFNDNNLIDISGGSVTGFVRAETFNGLNDVRITGGSIGGDVTLVNFNGDNLLDLSGGIIGGSLRLENFNGNNIVTVHGTGITFSNGFLNGTLQDGTVLVNLGLTFDNFNGANTVNIIAAVPEPSTLAMGATAALLGLGWAYRRRKSAAFYEPADVKPSLTEKPSG